MKIDKIDNSDAGDFRRVITWQYDHAVNLVGLIRFIRNIYKDVIESPWDEFLNKAMDMENLSDYGMALWSANLGVKHPTYKDSNNTDMKISNAYFKKLLYGRMLLLHSSYTMHDISKFVKYVYGDKVSVKDHNDDVNIPIMTLQFEADRNNLSDEEYYLLNNNKYVALCSPAGVGITVTFTGTGG